MLHFHKLQNNIKQSEIVILDQIGAIAIVEEGMVICNLPHIHSKAKGNILILI